MELYIHIPFCVRKCQYCSFVSFPASETQKDEYIDAVLKEAEIRKNEFDEPVETIYIGGGTPSLLSHQQFTRLTDGLQKTVSFQDVSEFSVEVNPGTVSEKFLQAASIAGVNRLSVGMQSADESILRLLGRIHTYGDVETTLELARKNHIQNLNLDLIFGIPGQTEEGWKETVLAAVTLNPNHISAYGLIPEEGTPLYENLQNGRLILPEPEAERRMYDTALLQLQNAGYNQYEVSNFSKTGFECRHNIGYWEQIPYVGLGISAASMRIAEHNTSGMICVRRTNPESLEKYYTMLSGNNESSAATETIGFRESRFETVMLALRMNRGISRKRFMELHGAEIETCYGPQLMKMEKAGMMKLENECWSLTRKGMDIQNSILVEFMD